MATNDDVIRTDDHGRVRVVTFQRPEARNAFNEALYDAAADGLESAARDDSVAVVVLTGSGPAFCAGTDLYEMAQRTTGALSTGRRGFNGFVDELVAFPKPLLCAVNGLAVGVGATMLGLSDLVLMSREARVRCPFTSLGVVPEAASSFTFPRLLGRQAGAWLLMSSEWITAEDCLALGLAWKVCEPEALLPETMRHAEVLASKPISSLVETKRLIVSPWRQDVEEARLREHEAFARLLGSPANVEAMTAFAERRSPNFVGIDGVWAGVERDTV